MRTRKKDFYLYYKLLFVISLSMVMTQEGVTAIYIASFRGHKRVVRLLLEKGADVNICDKVVMDFMSCTCVYEYSASWLYVTYYVFM